MQVFEEDLKDALTRYHNFLEKLEDYPEWREKVVEEVGKIFLMIHNNLEEGETKRSLFEQLVPHPSPRTAKNTSSESLSIPNHHT